MNEKPHLEGSEGKRAEHSLLAVTRSWHVLCSWGKLFHQGQAAGELAASVAVPTARGGKGTSAVPGRTPGGRERFAVALRTHTSALLGHPGIQSNSKHSEVTEKQGENS